MRWPKKPSAGKLRPSRSFESDIMHHDSCHEPSTDKSATQPSTRGLRLKRLSILGGCALALGAFCLLAKTLVRDISHDDGGISNPREIQESETEPGQKGAAEFPTPNLAAKIESLCSSCHLLPTADVEPRGRWRGKIEQMYRYMRGERPIPEERMPPIEEVIGYWASRAPEILPVPPDALASPPSPVKFTRRVVHLDAIPSFPAVSCVRIVRFTKNGPPQLLISDLRHGVVVLWTPTLPESTARVVARIPHPSHTTVVDLDGDGRLDILVANMGVFGPRDTDQGSVVWLRNRGNEEFEPMVLLSGLGRVNDVQAADFDGDGRLDLLVAVFGNLTTGMLVYLENNTADWSHPRFEGMVLEPRPGTLDVPLVDLDRDGHLDFVMLQAQEHERIVAFVNRGWGSFRQELIYRAPHPRWGSVTIRLVDLQGSGRTDVLFAHGDSLENPVVIRPYHGISYLENKGSFPFTCHRLTHFPGCHTVMPIDVDGDGRLDIVSNAFIPAAHPMAQDANLLDSVIWLRQTSPGQFQRYSVETGALLHPCGEVGDIKGDGSLAIVLGNFLYFELQDIRWQTCLTIYEKAERIDHSPLGTNF